MPTTALLPADSPASPSEPSRSIVFFDGVCSLCNSTVDFLIRRDLAGRLQFASLQGETAARLLPEPSRTDLNTMVLRTEGGATYRRSSAAIRILWRLGGAWTVAAILLWIVPKPLRDLGYRLVASNRYRLFGHRETCRMPTDEERSRILP